MRHHTLCRRIAILLAPFVAACAVEVPTQADVTLGGQTLKSVFDGPWSTPVWLGAGVNSSANEQNAILSRDELTLYFTSDRAGGVGGLDLYVSLRASVDEPWGGPVNLAAVNTAFADFAPNLSPDGHLLLFASNRPGGAGNNDIYVSRRSNPLDDLSWSEPVRLGDDVNTTDAENAPFFMQSGEDGPVNLFFNRGVQAQNRADIWSTAIDRDGATQGLAALVVELSFLGFNDAALSVRRDGREAFFFSNRPGSLANDIYTSTRASVHHAWSEPTRVDELSGASADVTPHLSRDGRTMIFGSSRAGGLGGNDLWQSRRTP